jgi:hypothetical protein
LERVNRRFGGRARGFAPAPVMYDRRRGVRRGTGGSHTRTAWRRIRSDREEDVRRPCLSHRGQHGRGSKRPRWGVGARRPSAVRRARRHDQCSPHGDARPADEGVATSRPGRCPHQTAAYEVGETRSHIRPFATREAIDPTPSATRGRHGPNLDRGHRCPESLGGLSLGQVLRDLPCATAMTPAASAGATKAGRGGNALVRVGRLRDPGGRRRDGPRPRHQVAGPTPNRCRGARYLHGRLTWGSCRRSMAGRPRRGRSDPPMSSAGAGSRTL